jgi:hypothetical protein
MECPRHAMIDQFRDGDRPSRGQEVSEVRVRVKATCALQVHTVARCSRPPQTAQKSMRADVRADEPEYLPTPLMFNRDNRKGSRVLCATGLERGTGFNQMSFFAKVSRARHDV